MVFWISAKENPEFLAFCTRSGNCNVVALAHQALLALAHRAVPATDTVEIQSPMNGNEPSTMSSVATPRFCGQCTTTSPAVWARP